MIEYFFGNLVELNGIVVNQYGELIGDTHSFCVSIQTENENKVALRDGIKDFVLNGNAENGVTPLQNTVWIIEGLSSCSVAVPNGTIWDCNVNGAFENGFMDAENPNSVAAVGMDESLFIMGGGIHLMLPKRLFRFIRTNPNRYNAASYQVTADTAISNEIAEYFGVQCKVSLRDTMTTVYNNGFVTNGTRLSYIRVGGTSADTFIRASGAVITSHSDLVLRTVEAKYNNAIIIHGDNINSFADFERGFGIEFYPSMHKAATNRNIRLKLMPSGNDAVSMLNAIGGDKIGYVIRLIEGNDGITIIPE